MTSGGCNLETVFWEPRLKAFQTSLQSYWEDFGHKFFCYKILRTTTALTIYIAVKYLQNISLKFLSLNNISQFFSLSFINLFSQQTQAVYAISLSDSKLKFLSFYSSLFCCRCRQYFSFWLKWDCEHKNDFSGLQRETQLHFEHAFSQFSLFEFSINISSFWINLQLISRTPAEKKALWWKANHFPRLSFIIKRCSVNINFECFLRGRVEALSF